MLRALCLLLAVAVAGAIGVAILVFLPGRTVVEDKVKTDGHSVYLVGPSAESVGALGEVEP